MRKQILKIQSLISLNIHNQNSCAYAANKRTHFGARCALTDIIGDSKKLCSMIMARPIFEKFIVMQTKKVKETQHEQCFMEIQQKWG